MTGSLPDNEEEICSTCIDIVSEDAFAADDIAERLRNLRSIDQRTPICHEARGLLCPLRNGESGSQKSSRAYLLLKRLIDLLGGLIGSLIVVLTLPFVALGIRIQSPGPVFFTQKRVGLNGQVFSLRKFRTMHVDRNDEARWANEEEDRIFGFGAFMRRYHIDEFPQFFSVLLGKMSLVGPRPEQVPIVERLRKKIPHYDDRHRALPGITGWSQVRHGYAGCEFSSWIKTASDLYYLKHRNLWMDISILINTLPAVLIREQMVNEDAIREPGESLGGGE